MPKLIKILIIEDEPLIRQLYSLKLEDAGFETHTASNGEEGLAQVKTFSPQLILLDILMPKMNGVAMLRQLRQLPDYRQTPVIILTNTPSLPNARECQELGISGSFLKADLTPSQLVAKIKEFIAKDQSSA